MSETVSIPPEDSGTADSPEDEVQRLRRHRYIYDVYHITFDGDPRIEIQFTTLQLPRGIMMSERHHLQDIWVGTIPPRYCRLTDGFEQWARQNGIGRSAIAAEVVLR